MKATAIELEFAGRAVPYTGSLLLFAADDAIDLVRRAHREQVPILGVSCLLVSDGHTEEPIDQIADYSAAYEQGRGCWEEAEAHIAGRRDTAFVFEVTLGNDLPPAI